MYSAKAPTYLELIQKLGAESAAKALQVVAENRDYGKYPHWDKLRHLTPPEGLTTEEWWVGIKARRAAEMRLLPLEEADGTPLSYGLPDMVLEHLHHVDQRSSGEVAMDEVVTSEQQAGRRFLVNSLIEGTVPPITVVLNWPRKLKKP